MADRRMLLNSTESFVGTMKIDYYCDDGKLYLGLNDNIKIIEEYFDGYYDGYYIIGFKKDLIVPEDFINPNSFCEIDFHSDCDITFDRRSIYESMLYFYGNFTFNVRSIIGSTITLYDYNYIFNGDCFDVGVDESILFYAKTIPQYYENINNCGIYAYAHILYDIMKYNNIEEGDEKAKNYITENIFRLFISSPTEYITTIPNVDLGNNSYIKSVNNYMYEGNYITEYVCNGAITHLRKGITLPKDATVYFPDTVTDIDHNTFENESNLKKVVIFGNCRLTYLDGFGRSGLENIEIYSDKIETIKNSCFYYCLNLYNVIIPKSIKYIEHGAFDHINSNFVINYKGTKQDWDNIYLNNYWYGVTTDIIVNCIDGSFVVNPYLLCIIYYTSNDGNIIDVDTRYINNELLSNTYGDKGELVFKNVVNQIGILFRFNTQLKEVWLPNYSITNTASSFRDCTNLIRVSNSERLRMEENIFSGCINLQQIEIDSDWIGDSAFENCTSLSYVKISKRIESISDGGFAHCTSLESIDYEGTIEEWNNIDIYSDWCDGSAIKTIHCVDGDIQL